MRSFLLLGILMLPFVLVDAAGAQMRVMNGPSAEVTFNAALSRLESRRNFVVHASWPYPYRSRPFTTDIRYAAPNRLSVSVYRGRRYGNAIADQIGTTSCTWNTGPTFHRVYCAHQPWSVKLLMQPLRLAIPI